PPATAPPGFWGRFHTGTRVGPGLPRRVAKRRSLAATRLVRHHVVERGSWRRLARISGPPDAVSDNAGALQADLIVGRLPGTHQPRRDRSPVSVPVSRRQPGSPL